MTDATAPKTMRPDREWFGLSRSHQRIGRPATIAMRVKVSEANQLPLLSSSASTKFTIRNGRAREKTNVTHQNVRVRIELFTCDSLAKTNDLLNGASNAHGGRQGRRPSERQDLDDARMNRRTTSRTDNAASATTTDTRVGYLERQMRSG